MTKNSSATQGQGLGGALKDNELNQKHTIKSCFSQYSIADLTKRIVVWLAVRGLLSSALAERLICWGGLTHD